MSIVMEFALPPSSLPRLCGVRKPVLALHNFLSECPWDDFDRNKLDRVRWKLFFLGGVGRYSSAPGCGGATIVVTPPEGLLVTNSSVVGGGEAPVGALVLSGLAPVGVGDAVGVVFVCVLFVFFRVGFGGGR
jgi:hypothetical protein